MKLPNGSKVTTRCYKEQEKDMIVKIVLVS